MNRINLFYTAIIALALVVTGCDVFDTTPEPATYDGDNKVKFAASSSTLYAVDDTDTGSIMVNVLKPAGSEQSYNFSVLDQSTAVEGTHYDLEGTSFTIAKDSVLGQIPITMYKSALDEPKTLVLKITDSDTASFSNQTTITLRQFFPYEQSEFEGDYTLEYPFWYGADNPQTVTLTAGSDRNTMIIENFMGIADAELVLDDSDRTNFVATLPELEDFWSHSAGEVHVAGSGSFSAAEYTITLTMENFIPGVGAFADSQLTLTKQ